MASILASPPETFTGTNGATPSTANVVIALNENGGSFTIQSNQGRIRNGINQFNRTSIRLVGAARADSEILFDWVIPTPGTSFEFLYMRHNNTNIDTQQGYYFTLERDQMIMGRSANYTGTGIVTKTYSGRSAGQVMRTRVAVFGTSIKARTWLASGTEDTGTWDISAVDSTITAAGYMGFAHSSATAGAKDFFLDNINAFDTETPSQKAILVGGSLTPGGVLRKQVPKTFLGSVTATGVFATRRLVVRFFDGSVAVAGSFAKTGQKRLVGSIAPVSTFAKVAQKRLVGSITPSATLVRRLSKFFGGSIAAAGELLAVNAGRAFGVPGLAVMTIRKVAAVRARIRKG